VVGVTHGEALHRERGRKKKKKKKLKEMRLFVVYKGERGGVVLLEGRQRSLNEHGGGVRGAG
jgi:hypothetical protein